MGLNMHNKVISRRTFLQGLGWVFAAGALVPLASVSRSHAGLSFPLQGGIPLEQLDYSIFSGLQGECFTIKLSPEKRIPVRLVEVNKSASNDSRQESFSLLFEADEAYSLEQKIYDFQHQEIGQFSIFIVPVETDGHTTRYEAVFSRLLA